MISLSTRNVASQRGISLVELMVGMVIGLIALIVMQQMAVFFDSQKRGSSGSAEAQNTGMIAMYTLETDLRQGGYGLASLDTLYCTFQTSRSFNGRRFSPVMILPDGLARTSANNPLAIPPGDAGTDVIVVMYSNASSTAEGVSVNETGSAKDSYKFANNITGFKVDDFVLAAQSGQNCTAAKITAVSSASRQITVDHAFTGATYAANSAKVFNIGASGMTMRAYAIRGGNLTVCDYWAADCSTDISTLTTAALDALWVPIANNVVGLRAQYGWDTSVTPDMVVDTYCRSHLTSASPTCPDPDDGQTAPADMPSAACDWTRIASIRLALVTRSVEKESSNVNLSDPTITLWPSVTATVAGTSGEPLTSGPVFAVPSQLYRYKVFQTTVPLRNVIWLGAQSSC